MALCLPERISEGDAKFQGFCGRWNKWEGQEAVACLFGAVRHANAPCDQFYSRRIRKITSALFRGTCLLPGYYYRNGGA